MDAEATIFAVDSMWLMITAVLVLFMQAGFAMLEVGFTRMKNAGAVVAKIAINLSIAMVMFWAIGFGIVYGADENSLIAWSGFFIDFNDTAGFTQDFYEPAILPGVDWFFQVAFCAVSLAIVFGTMLDRTKFIGYVIFAILFSGLIYPIVAHWTWGGGWLLEDGFLDFAGSSIVHLAGATAGLAGTLVLGPRIGKFRDGRPVPIPGHSIPLAMLGVIILWVGWMGFNPGSTLKAVGADFGAVAANTNLAAGAGVIGATIAALAVFRTLDVSQMGNGAIGGLVAITAPCAFVDAWAAIVIGLVGGLIIPPIVVLVDKLKVDDPLGALPAHGVAGIWGTLAVGLFGIADLTGNRDGLFYGGGLDQLWVQFYGVAATFAFVFVVSYVIFMAIRYTVGLRVSEDQELRGLDISEHGMFGYPERFIDVPGAQPEEAHAAATAITAKS